MGSSLWGGKMMLTGTPVTTPLTVFDMDRLPVPVNGLDVLRPVEGGAAYDRIPPWAYTRISDSYAILPQSGPILPAALERKMHHYHA